MITDQKENLIKLGGFQTYILGKKVTVKTWIHFIAGDTSGHNNLIGQYNSSNALQPYRDRHCLLEELSKPNPKCALITNEEYKFAKQAQILHAYSLHAFDNAFDKTPFVDQVHGIFGCVPAEMLHVTGNGIMKYQLEVVKQIIESGTKKTKKLHQLDVLHHNLVTESLKQSECDMPRMSSRNGVTDGTKMTDSERVGNMFMLLCVIHTNDGRGIFQNGLNELDIALSDFKKSMNLQLSFEKWVDGSNPIIDVCGASDLLSKLIRSIKRCFPRIDGNGWNLPKMHSLAKMLHYMQQFGSANNCSGQIGDRALKSMVKDHAQQTQRQVNVFASQCADREYESTVYTHAYNDIKHLLGAEKKIEANVDTISPLYRGQHIVTFLHGNVFGGDTVTVQWKDRPKKNSALQ